MQKNILKNIIISLQFYSCHFSPLLNLDLLLAEAAF